MSNWNKSQQTICNAFFVNVLENATEIYDKRTKENKWVITDPETGRPISVPTQEYEDEDYPWVDIDKTKYGKYFELSKLCGDPQRETAHVRMDQHARDEKYPDPCFQFLRFPFYEPIPDGRSLKQATRKRRNAGKGPGGEPLAEKDAQGKVIFDEVEFVQGNTESARYNEWVERCGNPYVGFVYDDSEYASQRNDFLNRSQGDTYYNPFKGRTAKKYGSNGKKTTNYNKLVKELGDPEELIGEAVISKDCINFLQQTQVLRKDTGLKTTRENENDLMIKSPKSKWILADSTVRYGRNNKPLVNSYTKLIKDCGGYEPGTQAALDYISQRSQQQKGPREMSSRASTRTTSSRRNIHNLSHAEVCEQLSKERPVTAVEKDSRFKTVTRANVGKKVIRNPYNDNAILYNGPTHKKMLKDCERDEEELDLTTKIQNSYDRNAVCEAFNERSKPENFFSKMVESRAKANKGELVEKWYIYNPETGKEIYNESKSFNLLRDSCKNRTTKAKIGKYVKKSDQVKTPRGNKKVAGGRPKAASTAEESTERAVSSRPSSSTRPRPKLSAPKKAPGRVPGGAGKRAAVPKTSGTTRRQAQSQRSGLNRADVIQLAKRLGTQAASDDFDADEAEPVGNTQQANDYLRESGENVEIAQQSIFRSNFITAYNQQWEDLTEGEVVEEEETEEEEEVIPTTPRGRPGVGPRGNRSPTSVVPPPSRSPSSSPSGSRSLSPSGSRSLSPSGSRSRSGSLELGASPKGGSTTANVPRTVRRRQR